jgi:hypothetical protein
LPGYDLAVKLTNGIEPLLNGVATALAKKTFDFSYQILVKSNEVEEFNEDVTYASPVFNHSFEPNANDLAALEEYELILLKRKSVEQTSFFVVAHKMYLPDDIDVVKKYADVTLLYTIGMTVTNVVNMA